MAAGWQSSNRHSRLPADWSQIRLRVLVRDGHRCTWYDHGIRCASRATDVDHITPGDDHRLANLRALCGYHHGIKSGQEGGQARAKKLRAVHQKFRRTEPHPGSL